MQIGACLAGLAIENSMLGATHALANPLTADYGIVHGQAVGLMLPHVIRLNGFEVDPLYQELAHTAGLNGSPEGAERLFQRVAELRTAAGLPGRLEDCGVDPASLGDLAEEASGQWTAWFNPRTVAKEDLQRLYEAAL